MRQTAHPAIEQLGAELLQAESAARPISPLSSRFPDLTVSDAYAIQQVYARQRIAHGARLVGHKIGATSEAIQRLFGIDTPDYGHLFDDMAVEQSEPISIQTLIQPMAEPEVAFLLAEPLRGPGVTAEDIIASSKGVMPCLEIIDSRISDWNIRLTDTIADNGSSARFVLGELVGIQGIDLATEEVALVRNGEVVGEGVGSAVLGNPAKAAAWLANALGQYGVELPADSLILSGSMTTAVGARDGDRFVAAFSTIGTVTCKFV